MSTQNIVLFPPRRTTNSFQSMKSIITGGQGSLAQEVCSLWQGEILAPSRQELDVSEPKSIQHYFSQQSEIDCLICNAAITLDGPLFTMKSQQWDSVVETNLSGAFRCARECSKDMLKRNSGHIIFISSYSALHPHAGQCNYSAAKAGLIDLTKCLAQELGIHNVRVNCILPGFLETKMTTHLKQDITEKIRQEHTLKRLNQTRQVAEFIQFLHQKLPHTSGQIFNLDSRIISHA